MLKICTPGGGQGQGEQGASFLSADPRKKQVTVFDPSASGYVTSANRKAGTSAPKMFAFDSVFTPDDSLVSQPLYLSHSLSHSLSLSLSLSLSSSPSVSAFLSYLSVSLCTSFSNSLSTYLLLPLCLSLSIHLFIYPFISFSIYSIYLCLAKVARFRIHTYL